ncbi:uncharacterized protein LOC121789473 [Salvia splendens]|uniref:uncharacterized protein LOC121789473 n=1 Tax=Salvia splendens TaxID=180675 RepID=UPI001C2549F3|nr:uncharacterized protein LOC121789473 [Salvia splendens]
MDLLNSSCCLGLSPNLQKLSPSRFLGRDILHICPTKLHYRHGGYTKALAGQNNVKKLRKRQKMQKEKQGVLDEIEGLDEDKMSSEINEAQASVLVPSRSSVLQACTFTSLSIAALGVLIRQVSHFVSGEGWPVLDCSEDITFSVESWHFGLIIGSVILVSSCRLLLLKIWPDFAESSKAANQQVLTSLEPLDYLVVAFLPGISEELLFRGALMPLFGVSWMSIFAVAALFGVLHLGSGRKYSFAVWATFVGVVYGYTTSFSSSIVVPMASHALNNLVGGISWRLSSDAD